MKTFVTFVVPILLIFSLLFVCFGYYVSDTYSDKEMSQNALKEKEPSDDSGGDISFDEEDSSREFLLSDSDFEIVVQPEYGINGYIEGWLVGFSTSELKPNTSYLVTVINSVEVNEFCARTTPSLCYSTTGTFNSLRYYYSIFWDNSYMEGKFPSNTVIARGEDFCKTIRFVQSGEEGETFAFFFPFISSQIVDDKEEAVSLFKEKLLPKIEEISIKETELKLN